LIQVARRFHRHHSTIQQLIDKYRRTGSVVDIRRSPRRRVTSRRQDRHIVVSHIRNRFHTAAATARVNVGNHNRVISSQTVRNRLREVKLRARRQRKVFKLSTRHRTARLAWARHHLRLTQADWASVLFVDETCISLQGNDGRSRVYRRRGERNAECCLVEVDQYRGGSIMFWAGISMHTRTRLVQIDGNSNAQRYQHEIIQPLLIPHMQENRGMCLAQDNAPCHVARAILNMLAANRVRTIPWPAASPDLNPIENVWDWLKKEVQRQPQPGNLQELSRLVARVWDTVPQRYLLNCVRSMRRRCQAVIAAGGGQIPY